MFEKIKQILNNNKSISIGAPLSGELVAISEVGDPTFALGMLGPGLAIRPCGNRIVAPIDGRLVVMFHTGHACSVVSAEGVEVLIHMGLNTVQLKGQHFKVLREQGAEVKKGDVLIEFDAQAIASAGYDIITPVVITNSDEFCEVNIRENGHVDELDEIISLRKK